MLRQNRQCPRKGGCRLPRTMRNTFPGIYSPPLAFLLDMIPPRRRRAPFPDKTVADLFATDAGLPRLLPGANGSPAAQGRAAARRRPSPRAREAAAAGGAGRSSAPPSRTTATATAAGARGGPGIGTEPAPILWTPEPETRPLAGTRRRRSRREGARAGRS